MRTGEVLLAAFVTGFVVTMVAIILLLLGLVRVAWGDECNPDLVSNRTPHCQLYQPQFRQCRPDEDLNKDLALLDNLCTSCPPGQCLRGFSFDGTKQCVPCHACPGAQTCPPPTVQIGHDAACGIVCSTNWCSPSPCNTGTCVLSGNGFVCICPAGCSGTHCETCGTTTTSSTTSTSAVTTTTTSSTTSTSTSTTSTTTSTTTTTTLALLPSTTFLVVPGYPTDDGSQLWSAVPAGTAICARFVPPIGITNATKAVVNQTGISASTTGFAIYPDSDGAAPLVKWQPTGCVFCSGVHPETGLSAFTLTAGTVYRLCACNVGDFGTGGSYEATNWTTSSGFAGEENAFVVSVGKATTACTGSPFVPPTTGAIIQDNALKPPVALLSVE